MVSQHPYASHETQPPFWGHPNVSRNVAELLAHGVEVDNVPDFLVFSALVPRLRRVPVIFFVFELMPEMTAARLHLGPDDLRLRLVSRLQRAALAWADRVITVSERLRRIMGERGLDATRITVVPNSHPLG